LHLTTKESTVAVDGSGDIISVCRQQDDHIRGSELVKEAVKNGDIKLDSYSGNHVFYVKSVFEAASWCERVDDYAPDDWNPIFQKEPFFYRYTGEVPEIIESATDFRKRIPASADYDEAQKVRYDLIGG